MEFLCSVLDLPVDMPFSIGNLFHFTCIDHDTHLLSLELHNAYTANDRHILPRRSRVYSLAITFGYCL